MRKITIRKSDDEIAILVEARAAVAAGTADLDLVEHAYRIVERHPYNKADDGILAAAHHAGIVQRCFLESDGVEGWSRLLLKHADGRLEPLQLLVYRQENPHRLVFDVDLEIAARRIALALPKSDPRQGEIAMLTLSRAAVRKLLNSQVAGSGGTISDDAATLIHKVSDGWDAHHRAQLVAISETPASYAAATVPA